MKKAAKTSRNRVKPPEVRAKAAEEAPPAGSAALRALTLLEQVAGSPRPVSLDDLVKFTRLSKPTAFRLLALLERSGMIQRDPVADRRYTSGHRLASLALAVLRNSPARAERHAILQRLVATVGETCNVTLLDGAEVFYLDRVETSWPLRLHLQTGSRVPVHCSSSGKLFLSQLPPARRDRLLGPGPFARHTERTITDRAALEAELAQIREAEVSADNEEFLTGIVCLAVPVRDAGGAMVAAVALQAPVARLTMAECERHLPALRDAALALAQTFTPDPTPLRVDGKRGRGPRSTRPQTGRTALTVKAKKR